MTVKEDQTDGYGRSGIIVFSGAKSAENTGGGRKKWTRMK